MKKNVQVVIIGAGQAGMAIGYYLKQQGESFILLDSSKRIGDSWRRRYESLVLFTPRGYSSLPGLPMKGSAEGFPTKDEVADYLEQYATHFQLPVQLNTYVKSLKKITNQFQLKTSQGTIIADQVVVASGAFQQPYIPPIVKSKNPETELFQVHSSSYQSPAQIPRGSTLVIGGGNSGAQIAVELVEDREVTIATNHPFHFLPLHFLGKSIFFWLERLGLLYAGINTLKGKWFRKRNDPIFGSDLKKLLAEEKVKLRPKVRQVIGNEVIFEDHSSERYDNIIWSTGFTPSYEWIEIEGALSDKGVPLHERGISPIKGLYYMGLPWQYQRGSALLCGVGRDAEYLAPYILHQNEHSDLN
ncbi:flavin-containing monooxygenase [Caldalkalibacillus mannanilyticus]|uniref:flavin-containing monooxygenase n=1 Tax=Caldalkalibacillus mannanilyticus TaxID=1418 RepID=UPI00046A3212|nr:NAD(P)/FAD-dependent oxidoreductase [Caldalkalibacillus mannanilyticus]